MLRDPPPYLKVPEKLPLPRKEQSHDAFLKTEYNCIEFFGVIIVELLKLSVDVGSFQRYQVVWDSIFFGFVFPHNSSFKINLNEKNPTLLKHRSTYYSRSSLLQWAIIDLIFNTSKSYLFQLWDCELLKQTITKIKSSGSPKRTREEPAPNIVCRSALHQDTVR